MNAYRETALAFACEQATLIGVVAEPPEPAQHDLGLLIVVGGPQYRAGSHRHFVQLARTVAASGYPAMRFDSRGMGDSSGEPPGFEHQSADIGAAIAAFQSAVPSVRRVVLWGLCDGASAALLYLDERGPDAPVAGLCLLNPWVRTEATLAQVHVKHYYVQRLRQKEFWLKLLSGGVAAKAVRGLWDNLRKARGTATAVGSAAAALPYTQRMARAWAAFGGAVQLVLSGNDLTAREFEQAWSTDPAWAAAANNGRLQTVRLERADHTLSAPADMQAADAALLEWLAPVRGSH